jgi:hypothetical protein
MGRIHVVQKPFLALKKQSSVIETCKSVVLLVVIGVLLFSIAPFTVMDQIQNFLSETYKLIANEKSQEATSKPELD